MKVPLSVSYYHVYTQWNERAVKEVTEVSQSVFVFYQRDGFVRAREENRELMPALSTKKDLCKLLE